MWLILKAEFRYYKWPVCILFGLVLVYFVGALANMLNEAIIFSGGKGKLVFSFLAAFEHKIADVYHIMANSTFVYFIVLLNLLLNLADPGLVVTRFWAFFSAPAGAMFFTLSWLGFSYTSREIYVRRKSYLA